MAHECKKAPLGQNITNCVKCNETCHESCAYSDDNDKQRCCAIGANGNWLKPKITKLKKL